MLAVCVILTGSLASASTAQASDAGTQPNEMIVNGGFEYPGAGMLNLNNGNNWTAVERHSGQYLVRCGSDVWQPIGHGFDPAEFGWDSSETDGPSLGCVGQRRANEVELQLDADGNIYAELAANESNTAIRQTIRTTPGVMYTVSLRHASLTKDYLDRMRVVMIADDGSKTSVAMTRLTSNGNGDKTGETSDVVATKVSNGGIRDHASQWERYSGSYKATGTRTIFTFESVSSHSADSGNLLDDISFTKAYPLSYDLNGGQGALPEQSK